ncbi:MAG TPA: hypothetical protein VJR89_32035 [Polyangiales bacterium]|nr:hypothetical protein [Polyangiales bacterium]
MLKSLRWTSLLILLACGSEELIHNPMVERWCGAHPCGWQVDGKIERIGTWHSHDFAVELQSDQATLSQVNMTVDAERAQCFSFSLIADVSKQTKLFMELDFLNDGHVEFSQRLPPSSWQRRTFLVKTPTWYEGVRFIVRKDGPGHAALAELRAQVSDDCTGERVKLAHRPQGVRCSGDDECENGRCTFGTCAFCDGDCESGRICGPEGYHGRLVERCVLPGRAGFGDACSSDAQCRDGVCCNGMCSDCCPDSHACADGASCAPAIGLDGLAFDAYPFQCAPGEHRGLRGARCTANEDCQSSVCSGAGPGCDLLDCQHPDEADGGTVSNCNWTCPRKVLKLGTCD